MQVQNLTELCAFLAPVFEAAGYPAPTPMDVLDEVAREERERVASINRVLSATENRRNERTLLRDERGSAYGEVTAEIPRALYFNLAKDPRFGQAALDCPEGIAEIVKQFPACRVKNVNLKLGATTSAARRGHEGINWRGSSMKFAV
jgi:hypothetical protein